MSRNWAFIVLLLTVASAALAAALLDVFHQNAMLKSKLRGLRGKLRADVALARAAERKFHIDQALREDQRVLMKAIHDRGNVVLDEEHREFRLQQELAFERCSPA